MIDSSSVHLKLPPRLYQQVKQRADQTKRSVEDELVALVENAFAEIEDWDRIPPDISAALQQLAYLDDQTLWQAARQTAPAEMSIRMQELVLAQQAEGLTSIEQQEVQQLQHYAHKLMMVRAEAALLLKQRGYDITTLRNPSIQ